MPSFLLPLAVRSNKRARQSERERESECVYVDMCLRSGALSGDFKDWSQACLLPVPCFQRRATAVGKPWPKESRSLCSKVKEAGDAPVKHKAYATDQSRLVDSVQFKIPWSRCHVHRFPKGATEL